MEIKKWIFIGLIFCISIGVSGYFVMLCSKGKGEKKMKQFSESTVVLPKVLLQGKTSIEQAVNQRRSVRDYKNDALSLQQISQLLWAAQGVTSSQGLRAAPSAGALYPLEVYLVAGNVHDLEAGVYKYLIGDHVLKKIETGDKRASLCSAALSQDSVKQAAACFVLCAVYSRTKVKYGPRGHQYVHMEIGAVAENVYLQAGALGIGTVFVGAFEDSGVQGVIGALKDEVPLCILPLGKM
ncbi:MAG: SagB/ThcOx family dehydrogenase [bacterium]